MKLLNLGCGLRYHSKWINIDFVSSGSGVIRHNLLKGIPFSDSSCEVVYHSHLLEHFTKDDAEGLILECYRVLRPGGVIRVVVPDLEDITKQYIKQRDMAQDGSSTAEANYDWMMLEMFDQCVRHTPGGQMGKYLAQPDIPNKSFVRERLGTFFDNLRKPQGWSLREYLKMQINRFYLGRKAWNVVKRLWVAHLNSPNSVGRMRLSGEAHLWMYDSYSLTRLLTKCGFRSPQVLSATESSIKGWVDFHLDTDVDGKVYKPHSLYMEACKTDE